jgi:hypothetical protein
MLTSERTMRMFSIMMTLLLLASLYPVSWTDPGGERHARRRAEFTENIHTAPGNLSAATGAPHPIYRPILRDRASAISTINKGAPVDMSKN